MQALALSIMVGLEERYLIPALVRLFICAVSFGEPEDSLILILTVVFFEFNALALREIAGINNNNIIINLKAFIYKPLENKHSCLKYVQVYTA